MFVQHKFAFPKFYFLCVTNLVRDSYKLSGHQREQENKGRHCELVDSAVMRSWRRILLLYLAHRHSKEKKASGSRGRRHSRYRKEFFRSLSIEERRRRYRKIPRCALIPLELSPWRRLLSSKNDQAFITMMGFDCESFDRLLEKFAPMFDGHTPFDESGYIVEFEYTRGRKREVQPADCLGLVLVWTRTRGALNVLQLVFGLTYSNLSVYLRFGVRLIVEIFRDDPMARPSLPSTEKIDEYKAAFAARHPLLCDCWATMDGLKLYLQQAGSTVIQERFYNGWTHDHYVTSVFCFCPDGTIPIAFFNVPGSVHDSQVAELGQIYRKLETVYEVTGGKCCVDSAFGNLERDYLLKSGQDLLGSSAPTRHEQNLEHQLRRQTTSARQTAEWGMLTIQASFPRIKDRFIYEERGERRIVLKMLVLLYNLRARMVGINQIRNTYMRHLNRNANEDVCF